jgi:hypothetical protein
MLIISKQEKASSAIRARLGALIIFFVLVTVFVSVMEKRVVTPLWVPMVAFAVLTAVVTDDPLPKRSAHDRPEP